MKFYDHAYSWYSFQEESISQRKEVEVSDTVQLFSMNERKPN
jgi:hypothetical protein